MFEKRLVLDHGVAPVALGIHLCSGCDWGEFLFGSALFASWWPTTHPTAAPSLPWPAMCPATPPTMAPFIHPLASAALAEARAIAVAQTAANMNFMGVLRKSESKSRGINSPWRRRVPPFSDRYGSIARAKRSDLRKTLGGAMTLNFETLKASLVLYGLDAIYAILLLILGWWLSGVGQRSSSAC